MRPLQHDPRPMYNPSRMPTDFDRMLRTYAELTVKIGLNLQPQPASADHRAGCQRRLFARGGAARPADHGRGLRRGRAARRNAVGRRGLARRAAAARAARLVSRVLRVAADGARDARRSGARRALDLRERSGSAERLSCGSRRGRAADDRAQASARSASISPATRPTGAWSLPRRRAWAARVYPDLSPADQMTALWGAIERLCRLDRPDPIAAWETHLAELAARTDHLNTKQYTALKYSGPGNVADHRVAGRTCLGRWTLGERVGHPVRAEPADRRSLHDAAQGSGRRHRQIDQAAQLRWNADRGLQPHVCRRTRRRREGGERAKRCCAGS